MDADSILNLSRTMASKAKNGKLVYKGERYALTFNPKTWHYDVTNAAGEPVIEINDKRLSAAKEYLKFWLDN